MPPPWTEEELEAQRSRAIQVFRTRRMEEPLEEYLEAFDQNQGIFEELLETTVDLKDPERLIEVVTNPRFIEAFRYLSGPPISADDLKVLADATLAPTRLRRNREMAQRVAAVVMAGLDRRRFPWVTAERDRDNDAERDRDNDAERPLEAERNAAVLASTALLATRRLETRRRIDEKQRQEDAVKRELRGAGLQEVAAREIPVLGRAPEPGQFCGESLLGDRKADIVVGLWDGRTLPIECKVSNSATNSVKRLKNDAAVKAVSWRRQFGENQVVPTAVLSGVYKLHNLTSAQGNGLNLFWAHELPELVDWIEVTRA